MRLADLPLEGLRFCSSNEAFETLRTACLANPDLASFAVIGRSEGGRPIAGVTLGHGPRLVTLVAGAHADEPVGPETLRTLVTETLAHRDWLAEDDGFEALFERVTLRIVPHANPDAEVANQPWITAWPDLSAFLRHRVREKPGRDIEFGYPSLRPENRAVSRFLFDYEPIALHASLHGMAFSEGALLLLDRLHAESGLDALKAGWREAVAAAGLRLHDHDRTDDPGGDKGFRYDGPGFWSTPESAAMRAHFRALGDHETAARFHHASMEWAQLAGYDAARNARPICLVTELPLWIVPAEPDALPGVPAGLLRFKEALPELEARARTGEDVSDRLGDFGLTPLAPETAARLQLTALDLALDAVLSAP